MKFESAQSIIDAKSEQVIGVRNNSETAASPATERVETKLMAHDVVYQKLFTDLDGEHGDTICTSERIKLTPRVHDKDIVFFSGFTNRGGHHGFTLLISCQVLGLETYYLNMKRNTELIRNN